MDWPAAGNGDFLGPGDEAGILGRRLVDGKGKGKAQFIVVIAVSRFLDDGGDEVEEFVCRLRRSRVVVVSAFQGFGHLAFYGKALFAHEADARSPDVRAAEIQGQEGPRFPSRRQAQIGAQRRKGALLPSRASSALFRKCCASSRSSAPDNCNACLIFPNFLSYLP